MASQTNNTQEKVKSPKHGITSAKDLTIELIEGRGSPYHRLY